MVKKISVLCMLLIIFVLSGCSNTNQIKNFDEFEEVNKTQYTLAKKEIGLDIDVCNSSLEISNYDGEEIVLEIAYDEEKDKDQLEIDYEDNHLTIKKAKKLRFACTFKKTSQTALRIKLPSELKTVDIDIDVMKSDMVLENVTYQTLVYANLNGNVTINNSLIHVVDSKVVNGNYDLSQLSGGHFTFVLTNGSHKASKIIANEFDITQTNGKIEISDSKISSSSQLRTTNGSITLSNLNDDYTGLGNTDISAKVVNGRLNLNNVYFNQVFLKTTNGDIEYTNEDSNYKINQFSFEQVNGDTQFNINAIIED